MNSVTTPETDRDYFRKPLNQVYVIDDDVLVRRSLHFVLETAGYVSWPFACALDFLASLPHLDAAPILLDVRMPDIDGIELLSILSDKGIKWPIIVMTAHADVPVAVQAMQLGATEFLEKPFELEALESFLNEAVVHICSIKQSSEIRKSSQRSFELLTPREVDVMIELMNGLSNKAAAYRLSLSIRTIEMHRANAFLKLGVKSKSEAISLAGTGGIMLSARNHF